jgi:hypothetical protein
MPYCTESLLKTDEDFEIYKYVLENTEFAVDSAKVQKVMDVLGEDGVIFSGIPDAPIHNYLYDLFGEEIFFSCCSIMKRRKYWKLSLIFRTGTI